MPTTPKHWNYFLAVESELLTCTRYVEFCQDNYSCYSNEFSKIIVLAASEVDSIFQETCKHLDPTSNATKITDYYPVIARRFHRLSACEVSIARYQLNLKPFLNWTQGKRPDWWSKGYNKLKHERSANFSNASLLFALNAVGAQFLALQLYHYVVHNEWVSVDLSMRSALYGPSLPDSYKGGAFWGYDNPFGHIANDT